LTARLGAVRRSRPGSRCANLARYRARSGSALAGDQCRVLVAVIVMLAAAARYRQRPRLRPAPTWRRNELALHASLPPPGSADCEAQCQRSTRSGQRTIRWRPQVPLSSQRRAEADRERGLGAQLIALETPDAGLNGTQEVRNWNGQIYVATPQLLKAFGSTVRDRSERGHLELAAWPFWRLGLQLSYGVGNGPNGGAAGGSLAHPVIQEVGALPMGTSAPNTVITEHAMAEFHIPDDDVRLAGPWTQPFTAAQISSAELTASTTQLSVESKKRPAELVRRHRLGDDLRIVIALGVLGMSVGLVRQRDGERPRTLAATGASSYTRRTLTAVTAGALAFSVHFSGWWAVTSA